MISTQLHFLARDRTSLLKSFHNFYEYPITKTSVFHKIVLLKAENFTWSDRITLHPKNLEKLKDGLQRFYSIISSLVLESCAVILLRPIE